MIGGPLTGVDVASYAKRAKNPVTLKLALRREGRDIVATGYAIQAGSARMFEVRVDVPETVRQLSIVYNLLQQRGPAPKWKPLTDADIAKVSGFGSWLKKAVKSVVKSKIVKAVAGVVATPIKVASKIALAPARLAIAVATGERIDKAVLKQFHAVVAGVKDLAPYVQSVLSFVPVVGTGINAGLASALALAKGQPITEALAAGVRGALPGGPIAAAAFDVAKAAVTGKPLADVALAALPLDGAAKKALAVGLDAAGRIASGQRVDKALLAQADRAIAMLPADVAKAAKIGLALGKGQVLQVATSAAGAIVPGSGFASAMKHVSPQALAALKLGSDTIAKVKLGNQTQKVARQALRTVAKGKAAAGLVKAGRLDPERAAGAIQLAVKTRAAANANAKRLAAHVTTGKAVKASLAKVAAASRAGNADARLTANVIEIAAKMQARVSATAQASAGGTAGILVTPDGRLVKARGWVRAANGRQPGLLYTGPEGEAWRGSFNSVSGRRPPLSPREREKLAILQAWLRSKGVSIGAEPRGCPLTALGIEDPAAGSRLPESGPGSRQSAVGSAWGDVPPDPEGIHGPLYPARYDDPESWPNVLEKGY